MGTRREARPFVLLIITSRAGGENRGRNDPHNFSSSPGNTLGGAFLLP